MHNPKISIILPIHDMENGAYFLWRAINSIMSQSFTDYEIIITKDGKMAENTNSGMKKAKGELIKIMYLDDYFAHENALQDIVDSFTPDTNWLATSCAHDYGNGTPVDIHFPHWSNGVRKGENTIGSPSVITIRNGLNIYFDERMTWVLDCDLYARLYDKYGPPAIIKKVNVIMGLGKHQMTNILTNEEKLSEINLLQP